MTPAQPRQQGLQYGLYLLAMQAMNYGIARIPPATLIGVIVQTLLFMRTIKVPWHAAEVCISAIKIIKYRDWKSFVVSNFEHGSDMHLYYNMLSFIMKGSYLEAMYGTANFVILLGIFSAGCSAMYVAVSYSLMQITGDWAYYSACAIGFSAVLFALKVVVICEERDRLHDIGGFRLPSKFAVWAELVMIHFLVPNVPFVGHFGGILVGCIYCYTFVGAIIDNAIYLITGKPILHEGPFYRRRRLFM